MKTLVTCLFVSAGLLASAGNALASEALAKKYNCLTCHTVDKKVIGPSYQDVAAKYKDDKGAEPRLIAKLKEGKDHPKIAASDAELKAAVDHVLSMK